MTWSRPELVAEIEFRRLDPRPHGPPGRVQGPARGGSGGDARQGGGDYAVTGSAGPACCPRPWSSSYSGDYGPSLRRVEQPLERELEHLGADVRGDVHHLRHDRVGAAGGGLGPPSRRPRWRFRRGGTGIEKLSKSGHRFRQQALCISVGSTRLLAQPLDRFANACGAAFAETAPKGRCSRRASS